MKSVRVGANLLAVFSAALLVACGGGGASTSSTDAPLAADPPNSTALKAVNVADSSTVLQVALGAKISETRINRTVYEYVYKVSVTGGSQAAQGLLANLTGGGNGLSVVQGAVYIGDVSSGATVSPAGTITFRQDRTYAFDENGLTWTLTPFGTVSAAACTGLSMGVGDTALFPPQVAITSAVLAPATAASGSTPALPEHCNVTGTISAGRVGEQSSPGVNQTYAITWQIRLPTGWNGRFVHEGGGGTDGSVPGTTSRLSAGYVMAGDDSGHDNTANNDPLAAGSGTFGTDPQARVDFAYSAIDRTQQVAKGLIRIYYDKAQDFAYFEGCSMGGREAMMVTQRLPEAFNGVVVGDPGFKFASMLTHAIYNSQVLGSLASSMGIFSQYGLPLVNNTYTNQDLQLISKAVLDACDALDGLADGIVNKPLQCTSTLVYPKLDALQCSGTKTATCLSASQISTIKTIYEGPITPSGVKPYYPWMWDPGIAGCTSAVDCNTPTATNIATGWRSWKLGQVVANPATSVNTASDFTDGRGGAAATVIVPTPPILPANVNNEGTTAMLMGFNLDQWIALSHGTTAKFPVSGFDLLETTTDTLAPFANHGSKVVIWQPQTGGPFSPMAMVDWYQKLNLNNGGTASDYSKTQQFARLFMLPGSQHCGGGPSTSTIDPFGALVQWVESGTPPARIVGTAPAATPWPGRTRPLCPFPAYAKYNGSGSIESEANFTCTVD
jgi:Tannase and feruloyl esterase